MTLIPVAKSWITFAANSSAGRLGTLPLFVFSIAENTSLAPLIWPPLI